MTRSGTKRKNHRRPPISFEPWLCSGCSQVARPAPSSPFLPLLAATGFVLRSPPEVAQRLAAELGFARLSPVLRPELFLDGSSFREARSFGPPPGAPRAHPPPFSGHVFIFIFFLREMMNLALLLRFLLVPSTKALFLKLVRLCLLPC